VDGAVAPKVVIVDEENVHGGWWHLSDRGVCHTRSVAPTVDRLRSGRSAGVDEQATVSPSFGIGPGTGVR
jgi:hypothetical protein